MAIVDPPSDIVTKQMIVPDAMVFQGAKPGSAIVLHKTACNAQCTAESVAEYFQGGGGPEQSSAHFVVGQDGTVVQCVHLVDGAGANGVLQAGHDVFWSQFNGNLNLYTISIEHVDPSSDNSTPLTEAQQAASFKLILWLVNQYGFYIEPDGAGQMREIKGHNTIAPIDRARCPGNYPWQELISYLANGGQEVNYKQQQANDVFSHNTVEAPNTTGIYQAWEYAYMSLNINGGPPICLEFPTVDWNGNKIAVQYFAGGLRIEYYTENADGHNAGENHGYDLRGNKLW